ncbi:MAG TPA: Holliday junction branch migration DNA helicase RuvB [Candidatus Wujingus californicus]|uniref:Holliday junction branch migration DNA helicase RuvB n=1 Tax=Candidatus Wujingus californicus TaxID=3367618 RepID=UPI001E0A80D2|nr:Holliday junction branch migration DNA helicase RuvB [Planctomycetota bacterium]MDO8130827.1 Holliday junction branch migration DNA helicase RuvB [Candidatus Brocadiales bacterium]
MLKEDILSSAALIEDKNLDITLRPKQFKDFVGQDRVKENLLIYIEAARKRGEPLDHILFSGPPGLGKTTLSQIIANEVNASITTTSGPVLDKPMDLAGILSNLQQGDILFIDEIHRLNATVEEYLYSAMEDFSIDIIIDQGPKARSVKINLPRFTLVGSTTREGLLSAPLRSRFGVLEKLEFYPWTDLYKIICNSSRILSVRIDDKGAEIIARRARGTPRIANRFLRRVRDVAQVRGNDIISEDVARIGLEMLGVDEHGLCDMDRKILETIIRYGGGPVGLKTIAVSVSEEEDTIEEVYESFLIQSGYLDKTPRGRIATKKAYEHLGYKPGSDSQKKLF